MEWKAMCDEVQHDPKKEAALEADKQLESLLARCTVADSEALHRLYELVAPNLFACIARILRQRSLAEDALQEVFITIWQRAGQYCATRGRPLTWMMSIARNRAIDLLRRERGAPMLTDLTAPDSLESNANWIAGSGLLEHCLNLLTGQQRHFLELAFISGTSHQEIADITGSPLGTVKSGIRRALRRLRLCLEP
jgi:RNA polymerase sigma-70 factor (ECF subfamily)